MKQFYKLIHKIGLILLRIWVWIAVRMYYRRIKVVGLEKVPKGTPVIFAPNHQYAFMDALVVVIANQKIPYFLVRGDIFKSSIASFLLRSLRMMPVYRQRDKVNVLSKNEDIFNRCVEMLHERQHLVIFPEGNHSKIRKIRPMRKGVFRIGFRAINENPESKDLVIVPVGINYDDHSKFQSDLLVRFGDPIKLEDYNAEYNENQAKTFSELSGKLYDNLVDLTINIKNAESYKFYENILKIYTPHFMRQLKQNYRSLLKRFSAYDEIISCMDDLKELNADDFKRFEADNNKFFKQRIRSEFDPVYLGNFFDSKLQRFINYFGLILFWPIYMYGLINNLLAISIPYFIGKVAVKDDHFLSSVKISIGLLSFPITYTLQGIIFYQFFPDFWLVVIYIVSIVITGILAKTYQNWIHRFWEMFKIWLLKMSSMREFARIKRSYIDLIEKLDKNLIKSSR